MSSSRKRRRLPSTPSSSKTAKTSAASTIAIAVLDKRRNSWDLSDDDFNAAEMLMRADGLTDDEMKDELRVFLYAKGIMRGDDQVVRKSEFDDLLNPNGTAEENRTLQAARERLRRIVVKGEVGKNFDKGASLFDKFVADHPEWGPGKSFVAFRDHGLLKDKPHAYVERVQHSGLCYMHAPVVLQHYLVAMYSNKAVLMLDMSMYVKKHLSARSLERRIWDNEGGCSRSFLDHILMKKPVPLFAVRHGHKDEEMESYLRSLGPALISSFKVEEAFESENWRHTGSTTSAPVGNDAMVLVGVRKEGDTTRYLVQNWWENKAFVEVDGAYLTACKADITFVQTRQTEMGSYPTNPCNHVECEMLDAQETFESDMSFSMNVQK